MEVGKKGRGKHWTQAEVAARQAAAAEIRRDLPVVLKAPSWLSRRARKVWRETLRQAEGIGLFDNLDRQTLALYCDAVTKYEDCTKLLMPSVDAIKEQQAWSRIITQQGDKLGLNPSARARLIKKKAEKKLDQFGDEFD